MKPFGILGISILLIGCSSNYMNVYQGEFDAKRPPKVGGAMEHLDHSNKNRFAVGYVQGEESTVHLNGVRNQSVDKQEAQLPASASTVNYKIQQNSLTLDYRRQNRNDNLGYQFGVGYDQMAYLFVGAGVNKEFFEIGINGLIGVTRDQASYSGEGYYEDGVQLVGTWYEHQEINESNVDVYHTYFGSSLYISVYNEMLALGYTATLAKPYGLNDVLYEGRKKYETSIALPMLVMQNVDISYKFNDCVKMEMGLGNMTGDAFAGQLWSASLRAMYYL